jgi:hypothetical protein
MVKTGESRQGFNFAFTVRANFCGPTCGRVLREPEMCPVLVRVEQVRKQRPFEIPLIEDHFAGVPRFGEAHRKLEATKSKRAMKRELMVVATVIPRMIVTFWFSDPTEFSEGKGYFARNYFGSMMLSPLI